MLVADARQAIKEEAPLDRVRSLTSDLQQVYHGLAASRTAPTGQPGATGRSGTGQGGPGQPPRAGGPTGADDVIDADFDRG